MSTIHYWPILAGDSPILHSFRVAGTTRSFKLRRDVGPYLAAFIAEYHKKIAPIDVGTFDDWAWAPYRLGRASTHPSDHCAGVAVDLNATKEGSQGPGSLTFWKNPVKRTRLAVLRRKYKLLEWGGDYSPANRDPMHWTFKSNNVAIIKMEMKKLGLKPL